MFDFNATDNRYTHMPFASPDAHGNAGEFCCILTNGLWKLHRFNGTRWKRLKTGLPDDATECGPVAEFADGQWKISFIAGGWSGDRRFRLYRMYGLDGEPMAQEFADVGYVWKDRIVYAGRRESIAIVEPGRTVTLTLNGVEYLYRVSCDPFQPNRMLISGQFRNGGIFSWAYQPGMKILKSVIADGVPAYKCAFYGSDCFYAERVEGFEERRIVKAASLELVDLNAEEYIAETETPTYSRSENMEFE